MTVASIIRTGRLNLGLTQQQVADLLQVSVRTISQWENGEGLPARWRLKQIESAVALDEHTFDRLVAAWVEARTLPV